MRKDTLFRLQNIKTLTTSIKMFQWSIKIKDEAFFGAFSISKLFGTDVEHSDIRGVIFSGN
jgi:hypothetical protein